MEKIKNLIKKFCTREVIFYTICRMLGTVYVKSELEVNGRYADLLLIPKENIEERYGILIEFKYIRKEDYEKATRLLMEKQKQARSQLKDYMRSEEIKMIPKLRGYSVIVIKDEIEIEEVKV